MGEGAALARRYFVEVVRPLLEAAAPGLPYTAARLGSGSDVLGFDDELSEDHDFGCRLTVLLEPEDVALVPVLTELLEKELPTVFKERPVRFAVSWDPVPRHRVEVHTVNGFAGSRLGLDPTNELTVPEWLSLVGQSVLEVVGGDLIHDSTRSYSALRTALTWYPQDLWLYVLSCDWARLEQELPLVGRAASRGDLLGSRVIAARLARVLIHLAFLIERTWPPYPKWAGVALQQLPVGRRLEDSLEQALAAKNWSAREAHLAAAARLLARRQAEVGLPVVTPVVVPFFDRPFLAVNLEMPAALRAKITDVAVLSLPDGVGSSEQWCDNVDLLKHPERRAAPLALHRSLTEAHE